MDAILDFLKAAHQSQYWPLIRFVWLLLSMGLPFMFGVVITNDDIRDRMYAALQAAYRRAGVSNTAAAINAHIGESLASKKLRGEKPATLDFLAMSPEALPWFGLELIHAFGLPDVAMTAAKVSAVIPAKES